jgi:hypothetical protein
VDRVTLTTRGASTSIPFLRSPDPQKTKPFLTSRPPRQSARRRSQKYRAKPFCNALARAVGVRAQPRRPIAPAVQSDQAGLL